MEGFNKCRRLLGFVHIYNRSSAPNNRIVWRRQSYSSFETICAITGSQHTGCRSVSKKRGDLQYARRLIVEVILINIQRLLFCGMFSEAE